MLELISLVRHLGMNALSQNTKKFASVHTTANIVLYHSLKHEQKVLSKALMHAIIAQYQHANTITLLQDRTLIFTDGNSSFAESEETCATYISQWLEHKVPWRVTVSKTLQVSNVALNPSQKMYQDILKRAVQVALWLASLTE